MVGPRDTRWVRRRPHTERPCHPTGEQGARERYRTGPISSSLLKNAFWRPGPSKSAVFFEVDPPEIGLFNRLLDPGVWYRTRSRWEKQNDLRKGAGARHGSA